MNRLYALEPSPTLTGAMADHTLSLSTSRLTSFTKVLAQKLGLQVDVDSTWKPTQEEAKWLNILSRELRHHFGRSLVVAGPEMPASVQVLALAMNKKLTNIGKTLHFISPVEAQPTEHLASLQTLTDEMKAGDVDLLLMMGGNPVYNAPSDVGFTEALQKVAHRVHLSLYEDETSSFCHWHLPEAHFLEHFSDGRASDGTLTLMQPLIEPLYGGKSAHSILNTLLGEPTTSDHETVQSYWKTTWLKDREKAWRRAVHDGLLAGSASLAETVSVKTNWTQQNWRDLGEPAKDSKTPGGWEVTFRADPTLWDGRFANNGWLQELPKPLTKLTWDNAALIAPKDAEHLGLQNGDMVTLVSDAGRIDVPIWITAGHAAKTISLFLGYGRHFQGHIGSGRGFDVQPIRSKEAPYATTIHPPQKTGKRVRLASTQIHHALDGRDLLRTSSLENFKKHPDFAQHSGHGTAAAASFYKPHESKTYAWGMTINLSACMGCNACVTACQSENNIPVVGKEEVLVGREMHWIRVDQYYEGTPEAPDTHHQPVMCMHCENAPCEPVCPVGATTHSEEGLNEMTYNRCIGTRYCANNCPYKVRRFNFFEYADKNTESLKLMHNPDVTVRNRGVMEKCTFCVQRINQARITAKKEDREIKDGEIVTACQSACPTEAIAFGNLKKSNSQVSKLKATSLNYGLLTELNTEPRVTYLAKLNNPNPTLKTSRLSKGQGISH